MKLLYKLFRQNPETREGVIATTSILGIIVNTLIAILKVVIGLMTSSIAIITEGANNATDALSSVITVIGTKLAGKHPDKKHPFGYGRIEYLTGLIIAVMIIVTGVELLSGSFKAIIKPEALDISYISLFIVAGTAIIKFFLGVYTIKMGNKTSSSALTAVGVECRNDSFISVITIVSAVVFLVFDFSVDGYAGLITSVIIIKAGLDTLRDTVGELIGRSGEKELADKLYEEIRRTDGIISAVDMMLHNYGPDSYSGSVNVEIDHSKTVGDVYQFIHQLQIDIMRKYNVIMVFGIYAVDNDHEYIKEIRKNIGAFIKENKHIKSFHAVYVEEGTDNIYCDLIVDYDLESWDELDRKFKEYMKERYPDNNIILTIETEYV